MIINFILKTFLRKEVPTMAVIVKGRKAFKDVPEILKEQVKQILIDLEVPELAVVD